MITGFFLRLGLAILQWVVGILPFWPFPAQVIDATVLISQYLNAWSFIFPIGQLLAALSIALFWHFVILKWQGVNLVFRILRGRGR